MDVETDSGSEHFRTSEKNGFFIFYFLSVGE